MFTFVHESNMMLVHVRMQRQYIHVFPFVRNVTQSEEFPKFKRGASKYVRCLERFVFPQTMKCISHADNVEAIADTGKGLAQQ